MAHDFQRRKSFLLVALAAIVLADIVMIAYSLDAAASRHRRVLRQIAHLLEVSQAPAYRVRAFRNAAAIPQMGRI